MIHKINLVNHENPVILSIVFLHHFLHVNL